MKIVYLLFQDKFATRFMQDADVFEKFKVIVKPLVEASVIDDWGQKNIDAIIQKVEGSQFSLVAAFESNGVIHYSDPKVKLISNGKGFGLLSDYIGDHTPKPKQKKGK